MKEAKGDLLQVPTQVLVVTTNGYVTRNGKCVMGKGIAKSIAQMYPEIPVTLGKLIRLYGNRCHILTKDEPIVVSMPVKPCMSSDINDVVTHMKGKLLPPIMGWACKANLGIIEESAKQLVELADAHCWEAIALPRAGCGAGELEWKTVKPLLSSILDDRFTAYTF